MHPKRLRGKPFHLQVVLTSDRPQPYPCCILLDHIGWFLMFLYHSMPHIGWHLVNKYWAGAVMPRGYEGHESHEEDESHESDEKERHCQGRLGSQKGARRGVSNIAIVHFRDAIIQYNTIPSSFSCSFSFQWLEREGKTHHPLLLLGFERTCEDLLFFCYFPSHASKR